MMWLVTSWIFESSSHHYMSQWEKIKHTVKYSIKTEYYRHCCKGSIYDTCTKDKILFFILPSVLWQNIKLSEHLSRMSTPVTLVFDALKLYSSCIQYYSIPYNQLVIIIYTDRGHQRVIMAWLNYMWPLETVQRNSKVKITVNFIFIFMRNT